MLNTLPGHASGALLRCCWAATLPRVDVCVLRVCTRVLKCLLHVHGWRVYVLACACSLTSWLVKLAWVVMWMVLACQPCSDTYHLLPFFSRGGA